MKKQAIYAAALSVALVVSSATVAQVKIPRDANLFVYGMAAHDDQPEHVLYTVWRSGNTITIQHPMPEGTLIEGYAQTVTTVDYDADSITVAAIYADTTYYYTTRFSRTDIEWRTTGAVHTCTVNSNTLAFDVDTTTPINVMPTPQYGLRRGVLRSFTRNGQQHMVLLRAQKAKRPAQTAVATTSTMRRVTPVQLEAIRKQRMVVQTSVFGNVRLHWGEDNPHIDGGINGIPFDTVLHFAGGTLALKRMQLPILPQHYQHFVEIRQHSAGDAYDRTGSLFVIPASSLSFFDGINLGTEALPIFTARDGQQYQGIARTNTYQPPVELVRFFTPFGIGHYNNRVQVEGIQWRTEAVYKQEITDIYRIYMGGEAVIGIWIGNYDAGGHIVSVDIKSFPNATDGALPAADSASGTLLPLFNTCNVLEMEGQNYGKLFATDSLTVTFVIPQNASEAALRYISTGHGGWDEGDEFVPKTNTLLIDGQPAFTHTPWRQDCATYRDLNPVSGNFWNGLSSSDYSRSGWCPGTATSPVYFNLMPWADGKQHTLTVAIPQGEQVQGMFSHWAVSGVLIINY